MLINFSRNLEALTFHIFWIEKMKVWKFSLDGLDIVHEFAHDWMFHVDGCGNVIVGVLDMFLRGFQFINVFRCEFV